MEIKIKWQEPPDKSWRGRRSNRTSDQWEKVASELRAKPGVWAMIGRHPVHIAAMIKRGSTVFAPPGSFEAVTRNSKKGVAKGVGPTSGVYARYVGDHGSS